MTMPELDSVVERLCHSSSLDAVWHRPAQGAAMPSLDALKEIMERLRAAVFPGYFGSTRIRRESMRYHLAANLDSIYHKLSEQILRGFCFSCEGRHAATPCEACESEGTAAALKFMDRLPEIRRLLAGDAQAAYEGDPAATSPGETIFCYPSMHAMFHHRIAHELYTLKVPVIPRIISEMAHSCTGIDIHPGATIGRRLVIDHGTGIVIGETAEIGDDCLLYQGVTLGGTGKDVGKRHPTIGNNVLIGTGAKVLGPLKIGDNSRVAANSVVLRDIPPDSTAVGVPAKAVRVEGRRVNFAGEVDQIHVTDPVWQELAELKKQLAQLNARLDETAQKA